MPLRAFIDGEDKIAPLLNDAEWEALKLAVSRKEKSVLMPCCNAAGLLRVSKLGTKHFYHSRTAECNWKPETAEHLKAKTEILIACRNAGYTASPEKIDPDWRADVYAERNTTKLAFEVQWSKQTLEETQERQNKYKRDDVKGCWFFRQPPFDYHYSTHAINDLPMFELLPSQPPDKDLLVSSPVLIYPDQKPLCLADFVSALLTKKICYRALATTSCNQKIRIVFVTKKCWKCNASSLMYYVDSSYISRCGREMSRGHYMTCSYEKNGHYEFRQEIIAAARHYINSHPVLSARLGRIKPRFSKKQNRTYISFGCPRCDAIFGYDPLYEKEFPNASLYGNYTAVLETEIMVKEPFSEYQSHWCYPIGNNFCEAAAH